MKIFITGDVATWNIKQFSLNKLNKEIIKKIKDADYFICNLEGPIRQSNKNYNLQIRTNPFKDFVLKRIMRVTGKEQPIVYSDKSIIDLLNLNNNIININITNNNKANNFSINTPSVLELHLFLALYYNSFFFSIVKKLKK